MCVCVCVSVCLSVCLSVYNFQTNISDSQMQPLQKLPQLIVKVDLGVMAAK